MTPRRIVATLAAACAALSLSACGSGTPPGASANASGPPKSARVTVAPPPQAAASYSLWLSATRVRPGTELVAALVNHDGTHAVFGVTATLDRWDGSAWREHRQASLCLDAWSCTATMQPLGAVMTAPAIGLSTEKGHPGGTERFTTAGLGEGWYRLTQSADEHTGAAGVFEVDSEAPAIAPLSETSGDGLTMDPALLPPSGGKVTVGANIRPPATVGSAPATQSVDDMAGALTGMADKATIERWTGTEWSRQTEVAMSSSDESPLASLAVIPALPDGDYRLVRHRRGDPLVGRFWVTDAAKS